MDRLSPGGRRNVHGEAYIRRFQMDGVSKAPATSLSAAAASTGRGPSRSAPAAPLKRPTKRPEPGEDPVLLLT
eukprot:CAMPEP_0197894944 /NCGR_PEP_ID=MMETSP1439-20131203/36098_1 /TAXON_ID=66791 /ORGANISM="Gonyaulax spinifera, Strain CCMP409" /LENGTH=72 /DNA_ID=CAMNT_0043515331 /DNA_START=38 /DNA_END=256 /DNA_ORIENTATION=+